ncbi:MAG TPA: PaaI family thioesterase [Rubrivivax sp.]|nr:PaaI family thioesterase [Rubrivivax sp.]
MADDLELARRIFDTAPFMRELGVVPIEVNPGRVTTEMAIAPRHLQHSGVVHAGVMASMADHTMGGAAQSLAGTERLVLTAELKTSLLRSASGERLVCHAWVLKHGRTLCFTEAEVYAERGGERSLVMKASATMAVTALRP